MNKIINITLRGLQIPIEEAAYQNMQEYIRALRKYFKNEEGSEEIVVDIESRFSELMNEKIRKGAAYITVVNVEEMITTMGRPEDFDSGATSANGAKNGNYINEKRRLYRDANNKILGGVCSGIANWLNIDPAVVRVLFAIVSFGGFGSGILIYIALWIFLPARNMSVYDGKRMFRNPDDKWFGGVAGGLSAYLNTNPATVRIIFALPLILSVLNGTVFHNLYNDFDILPGVFFGGLTGTFIFIYIVLWIVLPEARSPYEKMEMHGKTVDVNSIRQNVQGSMADIKDRLKNWGEEVKDSASKLGQNAGNMAHTRGRQFGREFTYAARKSSRGVGYVIGMIFKAIIIFIVGCIAISLFVGILILVFSGIAWAPVNNFLWTSDTQQLLGWGTLLLFIGAPILGILVWLIRKILNITTPGNYLNWVFGGLWTIGWVCLMFFLASVSKDFKTYKSVDEAATIQQPANGKLLIKVSQPELEYTGNFGWMNNSNDMEGFNITEDTLSIASVRLDFQKSADTLYHVTIKKEALGVNDADALNRIKKMKYSVSSMDSVLDLQNGFAIDKNSKYRFQNIIVMVHVPVGKKINIDETVYHKLNDIDIDFSNRKKYGRNNRFIIRNIRDYRANMDYTMDSTGNLVSDDGTVSTNNTNDDDYRWDGEGIPQPPPAPVPPGSSGTDSVYRYNDNKIDTVAYHYNQSPTSSSIPNNKEELARELEKKQKEVEALRKKLKEQ